MDSLSDTSTFPYTNALLPKHPLGTQDHDLSSYMTFQYGDKDDIQTHTIETIETHTNTSYNNGEDKETKFIQNLDQLAT